MTTIVLQGRFVMLRKTRTNGHRLLLALALIAVLLTPTLGGPAIDVADAATPLEAPALTRPADGAVSRDATPRFSWRSVRGADAYRFELAADPGFGTLIAEATDRRRSFTVRSPLTPGATYYWRVAAVSDEGEQSPWSATRTFTIAGEPTPSPVEEAPSATSAATEIPTEAPVDPAGSATETPDTNGTTTAEAGSTVTATSAARSGAESQVAAASVAESGGRVVVEAEAFDRRISRSSRSWVIRTTTSGFSGSGFVRAEPDGGTVFNSGYTTKSPELQFNVHFATTGTYHVWVRGWATGGGDDSVHVGLNGAAVSSADRIQFNTKGAWVWTKTTLDGPVATLSIRSAGTHTINVWMREDGLRIDQLLLTTDASFVPGKTATVTATPTPTPSPTSTPTPTPTTAAETMAVTQLMLVNADTDRDLWPLVNGATLDLATLPTRNLSVRADVAGSVGSVVFSLDGKRIQTESIVPYTIAGDTNGDYNPWTPPVGSRTLIVTPYSAAGASGSSGTALTVSFTVTDTLTQATPTPTPSPTPTAPSDGGSYVESGVACGATGVLRTVNVSTATQLSSALANAKAGDLIVLADGTYTGKFKATAAGTAANRITLCGSRKAVVRQADHSGTTLFFDGAAYWTVDGLTLRNGVFAVRIERSRHITLRNLDIGYTGQSGVLVRWSSTDTVLRDSWIHDTGMSNAEYGEGIYIGQNYTSWPSGVPDRSDRTQVLDNTFGPNVRAEAVDVKEGTSNGVVRGNSFDGSGMTSSVWYVDSWVDIKGNGWLVAGNRGSVIPIYGDGYEVTGSISGWGRDNVFRDNYGDVRVRGGGNGRFGVHVPVDLRTAGNVVSCSNVFINVDSYSVPACTP